MSSAFISQFGKVGRNFYVLQTESEAGLLEAASEIEG